MVAVAVALEWPVAMVLADTAEAAAKAMVAVVVALADSAITHLAAWAAK